MSQREMERLRAIIGQKLPKEAREKIASEFRELAGRIALRDFDGVLDILKELGEVFES